MPDLPMGGAARAIGFASSALSQRNTLGLKEIDRMTSMIAQPQLMADAAANIEGIRSAIAAANAAAAGPTTGLATA
ncbi:PE domain-containing protein, partial [Mycobacterium kansasii]|uniref:PE domain-containing protein n=1 Tax=Mycobacterium kansasii TaxID=1768 RepID=UPI002E771F97